MKNITVRVREDYLVPRFFQSEENGAELREAALSIGARAVEDVIRIELQKQDDKSGELLEVKQRLEQAEGSLVEALKSQKLSRERQQQLLAQLAKQQQEHDDQLSQVRKDIASRMEGEREKMWAEVETRAKRDAEHAVREALLLERERSAMDREIAVARMEDRHALAIANIESSFLAERKTHEALRAEHEGLTLKLISRLEAGNQRTGSSAALGRSFEAAVATHLRSVFGATRDFELHDVHTIGHSGDLIMIYEGLRVLIELKSYDPKIKVPTKEVEKLARDLAEVQPPCDAGIMISACSEITGHYSCGPLEVSTGIARVPVLFINNFLSMGDPCVTLHMMRVFLSMIPVKKPDTPEKEEGEEAERLAECARRCTGYLAELSKQSTELLRQVNIMKASATKLRETAIGFVEMEVARYQGIIQLMNHREEEVTLNQSVFVDPSLMSVHARQVAMEMSSAYDIGDHNQQCPTKDILTFIQNTLKIKTEKGARDVMKSLFLDSVMKHGHVLGIAKKNLEGSMS